MERTNYSSGTEWEERVGYSRAVRTGDTVRVAGTTATDDDGEIVDGGMYDQCRQTLENIESALEEVGSGVEEVVRTRMYVTDVEQVDEIARAHSEFFDDVRPVTTLVEVERLASTEMLVEIDVTAVDTEQP